MALENVGSFNTWCVKYTRKTKAGPEKFEGPHFFLKPGAEMAL